MALIESLLVGAIGGIGASVAVEPIRHWLERKRRGEVRAEDRHQGLSRMVEIKMRLAGSAVNHSMEIQVAGALGHEKLSETWTRYKELTSKLMLQYPDYFWRPKKIDDEQLRTIAVELDEAEADFSLVVTERLIVGPGVMDEDAWEDRVITATKRVRRLLESADERLDQLNW